MCGFVTVIKTVDKCYGTTLEYQTRKVGLSIGVGTG